LGAYSLRVAIYRISFDFGATFVRLALHRFHRIRSSKIKTPNEMTPTKITENGMTINQESLDQAN
jgi:hypothetical protein